MKTSVSMSRIEIKLMKSWCWNMIWYDFVLYDTIWHHMILYDMQCFSYDFIWFWCVCTCFLNNFGCHLKSMKYIWNHIKIKWKSYENHVKIMQFHTKIIQHLWESWRIHKQLQKTVKSRRMGSNLPLSSGHH